MRGDGSSTEIGEPRRRRAHQLQEPFRELFRALTLQLPARVAERAAKAVVAERLQEIVHRVDLEGAQRVLVVGRDEDHHRHPVHANGLDNPEAVELRHLQVEEDQVRSDASHRVHRGAAVRALPHQLDVALVAEQGHQPLAGQGLVVDHQRADRRGRHARVASASGPVGSATNGTYGILNVTARPPAGGVWNDSS